MLASGDDDGGIKLWDVRSRTAAGCLSAHEDFISDLCLAGEQHVLLSTSGDGRLGVWDLRASKLIARSEDSEDELLSCALLKGGRKVVCGSQVRGGVACFGRGDGLQSGVALSYCEGISR